MILLKIVFYGICVLALVVVLFLSVLSYGLNLATRGEDQE